MTNETFTTTQNSEAERHWQYPADVQRLKQTMDIVPLTQVDIVFIL